MRWKRPGRVSRKRSHCIIIAFLAGLVSSAFTPAFVQSETFPGCSYFLLDLPGRATVEFTTPPGYVIETATVSYIAGDGHCTSVTADLYVNGVFVGNTGWVPRAGRSITYDVTDLLLHADSAVASVVGYDCLGGCCGYPLGSWAGYVCLEGSLEARTGVETEIQTSRFLTLGQNYPNPFNPMTTIWFRVPERARVMLSIYNVGGARVMTLVDEFVGRGYQRRVWDGCDANGDRVAPGTYFYRMESGDFAATKKMVLAR